MKIIQNVKLIIDENILQEYEKYYFKLHPRAKNKPIAKPWHPSINQWFIMKRQAMNALKQKWGNFIVWFIEHEGYTNLNINECDIAFITYFPTKARHDVDNYSPKFIFDGLVESGFIVDDDSKHLKSLTLRCDYDKEKPRTEIFVCNIKAGDEL